MNLKRQAFLMGWIEYLCETYDNCLSVVGKIQGDDPVLLPLSHSMVNAQVEITLDMYGNFIKAGKVDKKDKVTIIPVTEDSSSRASNPSPHPLCDKLCYVAGDYCYYNKIMKFEKDKTYDEYIKNLENWSNSEFSTDKVQAIYKYLQKGTVTADLVNAGILQLDTDGNLSGDKIDGIAQSDVFIRFIVYKPNAINYTPEVWKDEELYKNYEKYCAGLLNKKGICYVSGKEDFLLDKHPSKIRNSGDKAKLISSNDKVGYTFRGRFKDAGEAVSVGYSASQKAHNALRWLIQKQGYQNGSEYIVAWSTGGEKLPEIMSNTAEAFDDELLVGIQNTEKDSDINAYTAKEYAKNLNKAIAGYSAGLDTAERIIIMAFDTADGSGQGRLAITFYTELSKNDFLANIKKWHEDCSWRIILQKDKKKCLCISAPSPRDIALSAYGTENDSGFLTANDKIIKECLKRILPCIVEGKPFPVDIMKAAVRNAGRPQSMKENHNKVIKITCAIVKKYIIERGIL
jgi:CRISPR-associated protein Csd1